MNYLLTAFCIVAWAISFEEIRAADHMDSPAVLADGRLDINDLYAFKSLQNPANTVIIVTVNPFAGVMSPTTFSSSGVYELHVDNNGDAVSDVIYSFYFSAPKGNLPQSFLALRKNGSILVSGVTGTTKAIPGGGQVLCKKFDDPFFFDLNGFRNNFNFTGANFFAGADVSAIVLEIPSAQLGGKNIAIWTRTLDRGKPFDRTGRPAINTVLISPASKQAFNKGLPVNDFFAFGPQAAEKIRTLGGDPALAAILLPDLMTIDTSSNAGFLNGRKLADDVIDAELNLLTNGGVTTDKVNSNDRAFLTVFPYLAAPQN